MKCFSWNKTIFGATLVDWACKLFVLYGVIIDGPILELRVYDIIIN